MKNSLTLTAMPWAWKTTIWKMLHKKLSQIININFIDFDDDILEKISLEFAEEIIWILNLRPNWITPEQLSNQSVAKILEILWDNDFLRLEWIVWEKLILKKPTILSASWSLPLSWNAMIKIREQSKVIYIDTPIEDIEKRLELMKVDRIVGMNSWKTLREILEYRQEKYITSYDYKFTPNTKNHIETNDKNIILIQQEKIFEQFLNFLRNKIKIVF